MLTILVSFSASSRPFSVLSTPAQSVQFYSSFAGRTQRYGLLQRTLFAWQGISVHTNGPNQGQANQIQCGFLARPYQEPDVYSMSPVVFVSRHQSDEEMSNGEKRCGTSGTTMMEEQKSAALEPLPIEYASFPQQPPPSQPAVFADQV